MKKILALLLLISLFSAHPAHAIGGIDGRPVTINPLAATTLFLCLNDNIGTGDDQQCSGLELERLLWDAPVITNGLTVGQISFASGGGFGGGTAAGAPTYGFVYSNTSSAYQPWLAAVNGTTPTVTLAPPADGHLNILATTFTSGLWQMTDLAAIRPLDTVSGHSYLMGVYDNTGSAYRTFLTAVNGASPSVVLSAPTNGTLTISGASLTSPTASSVLFISGGGFKGAAGLNASTVMQLYDTDDAVYRNFMLGVAGTTPTLLIAPPSGGTLNIVGSSIFNGIHAVLDTSSKVNDLATSTSANLASVISDETGSGSVVFASASTLTNSVLVNPTLTTPTLGVASATTVSSSFTIPNLGVIRSNTTTAGDSYLFRVYDNTGSTYRTWLTATNNAAPSIILNAPTNGTLTITNAALVTPALGTPASGVATNLTGTASGLTAGSVTTNANLTGPVTSVGNATTISANAVSLSMLATQATNTVLGNATSGSAVPTALSVGSCSTAGSALIWTTNSGFSCNTSITAASATGNAGTATALASGRTIAITGDLAYTSPSFDGSGNVTAAGTLATVNSNVGSFGSATQSNTVTVNGKGLITAISNQTVTPAIGSVTGLGSGVATWAATPSSANFFSAITDETGSGAVVGGTSPTITGLLDQPTIASKAASYTFGLTDGGGYVRFSSTANLTATIPANATTAFPVGTQIPFAMWNTGTLTVAGAAGVTLTYSALTYTSSGGYAIKTGTNTWDVIGGH